MSVREPIAEKLPANAYHPFATPWAEARRRLEEGQWFWLATEHPGGRPHVRPVLALWLDDAMFFVSGEASRKARNLVHNASCSMTLAVNDAHLVVEGNAAKVQDDATLQRVADAYASKYEWHVQVEGSALNAEYGAPTAGPPPYEVYELRPSRVFGFGTGETWSPTRWRF